MGKSVGLLGPVSGKVGNMVGYVLKDSKQTQGWREYKPNVRNPQSDGQMVQRVKMAAVNNLYRDLKEVIQRGMENTAYGYAARKKWLSMALGQQFEGPWIVKGMTMGLPIAGVPISIGSLPPVVTTAVGSEVGFWFALDEDPLSGDAPGTVGEMSRWFTAAGYREGDQVTFVSGWVPLREAFAWDVVSLIVNLSDSTPITELGFSDSMDSPSRLTYDGVNGYAQGLVFSAHALDALAVIVSRDGQTVGSHLRSTAYFYLTDSAAANWYSEGAYERAKRSYLTTDAQNVNWEQDPTRGATAPGETKAHTNAVSPALITIDAWRNQGGLAQVHDATNNIWRYVYNEDVVNTGYHKWLSGNLSGTLWGATAPSGAETTDAVRYRFVRDADQYDIAFVNWLIYDVGYNVRDLVSPT